MKLHSTLQIFLVIMNMISVSSVLEETISLEGIKDATTLFKRCLGEVKGTLVMRRSTIKESKFGGDQ